MTALKVIVFDFDGVILESADVKTEAFCELYAEHGKDVVAAVHAHHMANLGVSRFKKFAWIAENVLRVPHSEADGAKLGERFSKLALSKVLEAPFVAGAREALIALSKKFPLFVASGTPQDELDLIVDRRELRSLFNEVHGTPREKPAILNDLMQRFDLRTHEVLFIGDGSSDHDAAIKTGVAFFARNTPAFLDRWTSMAVPYRDDLRELPAIVDAWH